MSFEESFHRFKRFAKLVPRDYSANFLGAIARNSYTTEEIRPLFGGSIEIEPPYPSANEEYFEWVDLLEAVLGANEQFTFMELGAGFGRWSVNAALAARQQGKTYRIVAIEPEPIHFAWLKEKVRDNGLDPGRCELVEAAVAKEEGEAEFYTGNSDGWYGQSLVSVTRGHSAPGVEIQKVKTITLNQCLERIDTVDLIDMDVQSAEFEILDGSRSPLETNVRRVHIGTHGHEIEQNPRDLFKELGWASRFDFECQGVRETPIGPVDFLDGVQSWINPSFIHKSNSKTLS